MPLKTILFAVLLVAACTAGLVSPIWGALGYVGHYLIGPDRQWWSDSLRFLGIRYSLTLAIITAIGIALNWKKIRFPGPAFARQQMLLLLMLGVVWFSVLIGDATVGRYSQQVDHPSVKFTKIVLFALMLTHVATNIKDVNRLIWVLILGAWILGLQAYDTPYSKFEHGRLEGIGGPDFTDATFFAAFQASMLPIIAAQFMRSKWLGKILCSISGAFVANAIILTRTRGAVVGLLIGCLAALLLAPRRHRLTILAGLIVAGAAFFYLSDPQFLQRAATITRSEGERDSSAQSRIVIWHGALRMLAANPLGVGAGNFYQNIGHYTEGGAYASMDAHNTFLRCACELGIQGIALFLAMIGCALFTLRRVATTVAALPDEDRMSVQWLSFGAMVSIATLLGCCLTISLLYVEFIWWFLMLPVCLIRAASGLDAQYAELAQASDDDQARELNESWLSEEPLPS